MKTTFTIFVFTLIAFINTEAQDMQFTQFYAAPTFLNPSFAGANVCSRASLVYRNQWPGIKKTYASYLFSFDHCLTYNKLGVGLNIGVDEAGSGDLKTTTIDPILSYGVMLNRKSSLRFGLQPGVEIKSINFNKLLFGDQIYRGGKEVSTYEMPIQSTYRVDLGSGVLFNTRNFWFGVSAYHLNGANNSFYKEYFAQYPVKISVHSGIRIDLSKTRDIFNLNDKNMLQNSLTFAFNYRRQNQFDQLDIGMYYSRYVLNLGLWYRGIPLLKSYKGYPNNDALCFLVGITASRCNIGYSYDLTISNLYLSGKGAHEITLSYQFCNPKKLNKKKLILISCPKF